MKDDEYHKIIHRNDVSVSVSAINRPWIIVGLRRRFLGAFLEDYSSLKRKRRGKQCTTVVNSALHVHRPRQLLMWSSSAFSNCEVNVMQSGQNVRNYLSPAGPVKKLWLNESMSMWFLWCDISVISPSVAYVSCLVLAGGIMKEF